MDNSEKLATLGTQDEDKHKTPQKVLFSMNFAWKWN